MWRKSKIVFAVLALVFVPAAWATNMSSTNYKIIFGNLNFGGNEQTSTTYRLDITLGQTAAQRFTRDGYVIKAGFQYIHQLTPFSFTLSDTSIDFGTLVPDTPQTQGLTATVTHRGQGYEVKVSENNPMRRISGGAEIDNTACNGGVDTCTAYSAKPWTLAGAYGFGYNASGDDVAADFTDNTYYRPFANLETPQTPATFMSSNMAAKDRQSTVTMRINIDGTQEAGTYQTVINFIAVPKY